MLRWLAVTLLLLTVSVLVQHYIKLHLAQSQLDDEIAKLDREDPGWRLTDIEANRKVIPDADNGALIVLEIAKTLPKDWNKEDLLKDLDQYPPNRRLREPLAKKIRDNLAPLEKQIQDSRRLARFSQGRYPIEYTEDFFSTLVPHLDHLRQVMNLLSHDILDRTEQAQFDEALRACSITLNVARTVGDEPMVISLLVRTAGRTIALYRLERLLAQGQLPDNALIELGRELEKEAGLNLFKPALRGERAGLQMTCASLIEGKVHLEDLAGRKNKFQPSLYDRLNQFLAKPMFMDSETWILRHMTDVLAVMDSPVPEQHEAMMQLEADARDPATPILGKLLVPAYSKVWDACARSEAKIRCSIAAMAAERFRMKYKKWPAKLEELTPEFLEKKPLDPFTDTLLQYKATKDGVVVYSVGLNGEGKGDYWDRPPGSAHGMVDYYEFRLWNPDQRRLPPLPPPKDEDGDVID